MKRLCLSCERAVPSDQGSDYCARCIRADMPVLAREKARRKGGCPDGCGAATEFQCWNTSDWVDDYSEQRLGVPPKGKVRP